MYPFQKNTLWLCVVIVIPGVPVNLIPPWFVIEKLIETSDCVKTHVCMKNKPYITFKSKNKVKNS